jgi:hypothetical protein
MAVSVSTPKVISAGETLPGGVKIAQVTVTADNSYPAHGYVVDYAPTGITTLFSAQVTQRGAAPTCALHAVYDSTNKKVVLFGSNGAAGASLIEIDTSHDLTGCAFDVVFIGT